MSKIPKDGSLPTAEEFYKRYNMSIDNGFRASIELAIQFAKLHCEAQAETIISKIKPSNPFYKDAIKNAYPLENIK